jgi:hypothetical protein
MREGFRKNAGEIDPVKIAAALQSANSSIGYVKMMTPKHLQKSSGGSSEDGVTRIIIGDQASTRGRSPMSNWTGANMVSACYYTVGVWTSLALTLNMSFKRHTTTCKNENDTTKYLKLYFTNYIFLLACLVFRTPTLSEGTSGH